MAQPMLFNVSGFTGKVEPGVATVRPTSYDDANGDTRRCLELYTPTRIIRFVYLCGDIGTFIYTTLKKSVYRSRTVLFTKRKGCV